MMPPGNRISLWLMTWMSCFSITAFAIDATGEHGEVTRVANWIDQQIDARLDAAHVSAAPLADELEFLRRVYLDIGGKIPAVSTVRDFLANTQPDKRRQVVDQLLESTRFAVHFSNVFASAWLTKQSVDPFDQSQGFDDWLRMRLMKDANYASIVRSIIESGEGSSMSTGGIPGRSPMGFFTSRQFIPEDSAAAIANKFLGVRIDCAQCHDHPFDTWTQTQFKAFAALMTFPRNPRTRPDPPGRELVPAAFLDATKPDATAGSRRYLTALAAWTTQPKNPYFAKAAVNRIWQQFFGLGLVNPVDDLSDHNPPSHPELLHGLAREFADHEFDLKFIVRAITASKTYQRSSKNQIAGVDPSLFASMSVRALSSSQFIYSLEQAAGAAQNVLQGAAFSGRRGTADEFDQLFTAADGAPREQGATTLQALALMNGQRVSLATTIDRGPTLTAISNYPGMSTRDRIEAIYLATVSRPPTEQEYEVVELQLTPTFNLPATLSDLMWVLLNSAEFLTNH